MQNRVYRIGHRVQDTERRIKGCRIQNTEYRIQVTKYRIHLRVFCNHRQEYSVFLEYSVSISNKIWDGFHIFEHLVLNTVEPYVFI